MAAIAREAGDLQRSRSTLEELHLGLERVHESSDSSSAESIEVASLHAKHALEVGLTSLASGENERALADFNESIDRSPPRSIGHIALVNAARAGKIDGLLALQRAREAELLAHELLTAQTSTLPAGHRWIAATRSALGEALYLQGRADAAEPLVASAHSILSTALSAESSLVRASRRRMDELAMRLGRAVRTAPDVPETVPEVRAADIAKPN
jgi:tetratricopeptide (TPR) repeat protein